MAVWAHSALEGRVATRLRSGGIFNYSITRNLLLSLSVKPHHNHNRFTALFSRTTRVSRCQKRTCGLYSTREDWQTATMRLGATASGLTSAHLHHPPFFTGRMPFLPPENWLVLGKVRGKSRIVPFRTRYRMNSMPAIFRHYLADLPLRILYCVTVLRFYGARLC